MTPDELRDWRKQRGLSQRGLADFLGCHWRTVQDMERGVSSIQHVYVLALRYIDRSCLDRPTGRRSNRGGA